MSNMDWKAELPVFRETADKFFSGEIKAAEYKGVSGKFGSYAQKGGQVSMLRLRMAGGRLTKERFAYVAESILKYDVPKAHFTTCQTIQFHDLEKDALYAIMEGALDHDIITIGGGGDYPRNTMASPLSGVEEGEYFDVLPYAEATGNYLLGFVNAKKMPRKLKVCFSNSPKNVPHATFRDLGFVAREDGRFDVWSAGGLGNGPKFGVQVAEAVEPAKILNYVKAMRDLFMEYGNYENRAKARTRFMQDVLGDEYVEKFNEKLQAVLASGEVPDLEIEIPVLAKKGDGSTAEGKRVIPQKQEGLYAVEYHPIGGTPDPKKLVALYNVIKDMEDVECRIAPYEALYIINLTGDEAKKVLEVTDDSAKTLFETSVACIGSTICQQGLRDSQGLLAAAVKAADEAGIADGALPVIHISGCTSSCGTHQIGVLGFNGTTKMIDKKAISAFNFHIGGCDLQGKERMGETLGAMAEDTIPAFLVEVGKAVMAEGKTFDEWFEDDTKLRAIAAKYLL